MIFTVGVNALLQYFWLEYTFHMMIFGYVEKSNVHSHTAIRAHV